MKVVISVMSNVSHLSLVVPPMVRRKIIFSIYHHNTEDDSMFLKNFNFGENKFEPYSKMPSMPTALVHSVFDIYAMDR